MYLTKGALVKKYFVGITALHSITIYNFSFNKEGILKSVKYVTMVVSIRIGVFVRVAAI